MCSNSKKTYFGPNKNACADSDFNHSYGTGHLVTEYTYKKYTEGDKLPVPTMLFMILYCCSYILALVTDSYRDLVFMQYYLF